MTNSIDSSEHLPAGAISAEWTVTAPYSGVRADRALSEASEAGALPESIPKLSRSQIQKLIEQGRIRRAAPPGEEPAPTHVPLLAKTPLFEGDVLRFELPPPRPLELQPDSTAIEVLFEDPHLIVINKPPGLTVHPSDTQPEGTLVHRLLHHVTDLSGIGGVLRPGIVHRLDKDTSGALVVAKTDAAHQALVELFSRHDIERAYWALCYTSPSVENGTIRSTLGRHETDRKRMAMNVKGGREAVTHYTVLEKYEAVVRGTHRKGVFASLVEARLETGRTHQVRVHLTSLGASLLGDPVYGTPTDRQSKWMALPPDVRRAVEQLPGQALHARVLGFVHPITGEKLRFEAPAPQAFAHLLETLRNYRGPGA